MRPTQRFIFLSILCFLFYYLFLRPAPPKIPVESTDELPVAKINKLLKWKIEKSRPVIFTIADKTTLDHVYNIKEKLAPWGRVGNFVVLCLDEECVTMHAPGIKRIDVSMVKGGRETILLLFAYHLSTKSHPFVHLAPFICFTGAHDPFSRMLKLTDTSWDIQFMEENNKLDAGFFFARPTEATQKFLSQAVKMIREKKYKSYKAATILRETIRNTSVRFRLLDTVDFKSWSDHQSWEAMHFATEAQIDKLIYTTTVIHFTCIDPIVQPYFAKLFGGWSDHNGYYTNIRGRYLSVAGISGSREQLVNFVALMVQVALDTGRILILPYHVENIQKRTKMVGKEEVPDFIRVPTFPFYRVIDTTSLDPIVEYVEASFPLNREKYSWKEKYEATITVGEELLEHEPWVGYPRLVTKIAESAGADVVKLDLKFFEMRNWQFEGIKYGYIRNVRDRLRVCQNIDEKETRCGKRCITE
ncbi:hypothetical protein ABW19_dt0208633 [Dactylella cylindrospora]|nr:hypothetical protein ABW19_dt0208633 [Dactylella cylindrospora]